MAFGEVDHRRRRVVVAGVHGLGAFGPDALLLAAEGVAGQAEGGGMSSGLGVVME